MCHVRDYFVQDKKQTQNSIVYRNYLYVNEYETPKAFGACCPVAVQSSKEGS